MAESPPDKLVYENNIAERFGGQKELELVVLTLSGIPSPELKQAANGGGLFKNLISPMVMMSPTVASAPSVMMTSTTVMTPAVHLDD
jgi:hypothetical protein